jgi:uncharacterized protein YcaQ
MSNFSTKTPIIELSPDQARKIVLLSQGIHKKQAFGSGKAGTLRAIEWLGYVQIDSISVVQRAHHHSLWNRVNGYQPTHLEQLLEDKQIFEYWAHAAAYLPIRDYRFSLARKHAIASGDRHWFDKDRKLAAHILQRITAEGPLQARDFEQRSQRNNGWWDWKPAKKALEQLFMEGELMVVKRQNFQKIYDLTVRVLPDGLDTSPPTADEYCSHLISRFLIANGIAKLEQVGYLRKGIKTSLEKQCEEMLENGQLIIVTVGSQRYLALPHVTKLLEKNISRTKVKILSPFDNLLIQRQRAKDLFDFDYHLECYLPAPKRRYGYFCLPLLWGQRFAGRMDIKMDRKAAVLNICHLHIETGKVEEFLIALQPSLTEFMSFNRARHLQIDKISSHITPHHQPTLQRFKQSLIT